jgi:hypothetical protein
MIKETVWYNPETNAIGTLLGTFFIVGGHMYIGVTGVFLRAMNWEYIGDLDD